MVLKYIKSIWQSNYISQARTEVTTFIDTADEQLQSLKPSLKEGTDIFFTNLEAQLNQAVVNCFGSVGEILPVSGPQIS